MEGDRPIDFSPDYAVLFFSERWAKGESEIFAGRPLRVIDIRFDREKIRELAGSLLDPADPGSLIYRNGQAGAPLMLVFPASADLIEVAQEIADCRYEAPEIRQIFLHGLALKALAIALDTLGRPYQSSTQLDDVEVGRIKLARDIIDSRFFEPWTIPLLAKRSGLSETRLKAGFRVVIGVSVRSYLRQVRVHAACRLIQNGSTITDAALESAFGNLSHFSKTFREITGLGPRELSKRRTEYAVPFDRC